MEVSQFKLTPNEYPKCNFENHYGYVQGRHTTKAIHRQYKTGGMNYSNNIGFIHNKKSLNMNSTKMEDQREIIELDEEADNNKPQFSKPVILYLTEPVQTEETMKVITRVRFSKNNDKGKSSRYCLFSVSILHNLTNPS